MTFNNLSACCLLIGTLSLVSCSAPAPKRQAFPQLDKTVQAHIKAGDKVVYPQLVHSPKPEYPSLPASGSVWAVMRVDEQGRVDEVKTIGDAPKLYASAIQKALMQWRFEPGKINEIPSVFPMQVKITFTRSVNADVLKAAQSQDGLIYSPQEWLLRTTFPQLTRYLGEQSQKGRKLVHPKMIKRPGKIRHPDPTKTGTLLTAFIIDEKGRPQNIHILGNVPKRFQETVTKAIHSAEFQAGTLDGKPHAHPAGMSIKFVTLGYSDD